MHALPSARRRRTAARSGAALLGLSVVTGTLVATAGAASAHVRVTPDEAEPGSYALLTFRVPTESDTASTTKVEVTLPTDTPFTSVSVEPIPGWTAQVVTEELPEPVTTAAGATVTQAPAAVVWTADDPAAAIAPGEFRRFAVSAGAVPDVDSVVLPATQTYSDGTVVAWDEEIPASGVEPEHPAPTLYVGAEAPTAKDAHAGAGAAGTGDAAEASDDGGALAVGLGAAGLGLGLVGAGTGVAALARTRSGRVAR